MATSLKFYTDSALTTEVTVQDINQLPDGSSADVDKLVYLGSTESGSVFKVKANPGVSTFIISIVDATPASGIETSDIKLAYSLANLDTATAGAPLDTGLTQINGGSGNGYALYIRSSTPVLAASNSDITLETSEAEETL